MAFRCRPMRPEDAEGWDRLVRAAPEGTFFHLAAWREVIERAFRHRTHYALCERDGQVVGVLPLARLRSRLFGDTLVSTPFCVYGGPLAADAQARDALLDHAADLLRGTGAAALELRERDALPDASPATAPDAPPLAANASAPQADAPPRTTDALPPSAPAPATAAPAHPPDAPGAHPWVPRPELYVTFRRPITGDAARDLNAVPRKQRAMVRKGIALGLKGVQDEGVDRLHRVYAESVRNLGTPTFGRRYFVLLRHLFPDSSDVLTVEDDGQAIAAVLNFRFRDEVLPYYGGGTAQARARAGNDFMYWEVMRRAGADGARLFDFGRSKLGTGSFAFKKHWGFEPTPLQYRFLLRPGAAMPDNNPLNPKYRLMVAAWRRLPLPVANRLGPLVVRGVG